MQVWQLILDLSLESLIPEIRFLFFSNYRFIIAPVGLSSLRAKREVIIEGTNCTTEHLSNYSYATKLGLQCYVTAEIEATLVSGDGLRVNIGDGKLYNGYYNAPLGIDTDYMLAVSLAVTLKVEAGIILAIV